jgi:hypothetical protein
MAQNEKYCIIIRSTLNTNKRIEKVKILQVLPENDCYVELKGARHMWHRERFRMQLSSYLRIRRTKWR